MSLRVFIFKKKHFQITVKVYHKSIERQIFHFRVFHDQPDINRYPLDIDIVVNVEGITRPGSQAAEQMDGGA